MSEEQWSRERVLAIFGLTEDELAVVEAIDGHEAARAAAAAERGEFERYVRERMSEG